MLAPCHQVFDVLLQALEMPRSARLVAAARRFSTPLPEGLTAAFPAEYCGMERSP